VSLLTIPIYIAVGHRTTLNDLYAELKRLLEAAISARRRCEADLSRFSVGDVRHNSQADIGKTRRLLGYEPMHRIGGGLETAMPW